MDKYLQMPLVNKYGYKMTSHQIIARFLAEYRKGSGCRALQLQPLNDYNWTQCEKL
jgi:predicted xylose isomerase-like sugar epimerase